MQHTLGHVECPACEALRSTLLLGGALAGSHSFSEAAALWLESRMLAGNLEHSHLVSARTLRDNRQHLRRLEPFFGALRLDAIHAGHLRGYQLERRGRAGARKINQELTTLHQILARAGLWVGEIAGAYHPLPVQASDVPRALTPEQQERFLAIAASRKEWRLVYWYALVALQTTCNSGEMRGLHVGDVNLFDQVLEVRAEHAKNRFRVRTIPLSDSALWALDRIYQRARGLGALAPQHYLFPYTTSRTSWDPNRPMSDSGLKRSFNAVRAAAGVPWLRIYDLRHSAITRLAEAGTAIAVIMDMAGHISPAMTRHYTQISLQAKRRAVSVAFDSTRAGMRPQVARAATGK